MAEETKNNDQAGAIWIKEGTAKGTVLSVGIDGEMYVGFKNDKKGDNAKAPDYNICRKKEDGKFEIVGAAWAGTTAKDRTKLEIKLELTENAPVYFTAVARDGELKGNQADMTILRHATKEEQLEMDVKAEAGAVEAPRQAKSI